MSFLPKLNKYLLWATLVVLPWQLRHTWLFADHAGEFFEYSSLSFYLSDILISGLLVLWLWEILTNNLPLTWGPKWLSWSLGILVGWLWVTVIFAHYSTGNIAVAALAAGHFTLFYLFYLYLINQITNWRDVFWPLVVGLLLQSGIGLLQYLFNYSLGLRWLGESVLNPAELGIPVVLVEGARQLRAHSTLPHANLLGGWLGVLLPLSVAWYWEVKISWQKWLIWLVSTLGLITLILSYSRGAWLAAGIALVGWWVSSVILLPQKKYGDSKFWFAICVVGIILINQWPIIISRFNVDQIPLERESVVSRLEQLDQFSAIHRVFPIQGVGIGQYVIKLEQTDIAKFGWHYNPTQSGWEYNLSHQVWDYQPVHNLFLLVLAETGWVGLLLLFSVLISVLALAMLNIRRRPNHLDLGLAWTLVAVVFVGMFDHYLWTLQQGRLILFLSISLIAVSYNLNQSLQNGRTNEPS